MWWMLLGLWKARRARKAAVTIIGPLVERSRRRLNGIPGPVWFDPYLIGFMVMLITLIARRRVNVLDNQALGLVQCGAWGTITGLKADLVGEETLHCCAIGDRDFARGCCDAANFDLALHGGAIGYTSDLTMCPKDDEGFASEGGPHAGDAIQLWDHYFETHVINATSQRHIPERESDLVRTYAR
jgi:hypothetical protein